MLDLVQALPGSRHVALRLAFTALFAIPGLAGASEPVIGSVEGIDPHGIVTGWAIDQDDPDTPISVHFYADGPAGTGRFLGLTQATVLRESLAPLGAHGFSFQVPPDLFDDASHTVYAYGIDLSGIGTENLALGQTPAGFRLSPSMATTSVLAIDNGVIRVGLETRCGGTISEFRSGGVNLVNNFDCTGRQVQASFYDGNASYDACAGCTGVWGWNPVQGGDKYNVGSAVQSQSSDGTTAYIATRPLEWNPDDKGGGPGRPVVSDVLLEQWLSFVPGTPKAVRLHYRLTHTGSDRHANASQEFPAVYVNRGFDQFVYYGGSRPWTQDAVTLDYLDDVGEPMRQRYVPERWAALVNDANVGLTVYVPGQFPYVTGARWDGGGGEQGYGANYFAPRVPYTLDPGSVLEGDVYLVGGDYREARQTIYALRASAGTPDVLPPLASADTPAAGQTLSGSVLVSGWGFDDTGVARVDVFIDGSPAGLAAYGSPRADLAAVFPSLPPSVGWMYAFDTRRLQNGPARVNVAVTDLSGHVAWLADVPVTIDNPPADVTAPTVAITSMKAGARDLQVSVSASDNDEIAEVGLYIDGVLQATAKASTTVFKVPVRSFGLGSHQVAARAVDRSGNAAVSPSVTWVRKR